MGRKRKGELRFAGGRWTLRVMMPGGERETFAFARCRDERKPAPAEARAELITTLIDAFHAAGVLETKDARELMNMAASDPDAMLPAVRKVAERLTAGTLPDAKGNGTLTFRQLGEQWTSGALAQRHPDHVRVKKSADQDARRLRHVYEVNVGGGVKLGSIALDRLALDHFEIAMQALPDAAQRPATRRHYAQVIHRLLTLAVYPCRVIQASPLPRGFMPKVGKPPAYSFLYPSEDRKLLACKGVPIERRMLWGVLAREGMRHAEALALRWSDLDLAHGVLTLDENKTDEPRAWALGADVVRALKAWKKLRRGKAQDAVFCDNAGAALSDRHAADQLRADLAAAGVKRAELFKRTKTRQPIRVHDLRGTFVTLALADGKSETWVQDRTGHTSSIMINRYRRAARTAAELQLGWLAPLDRAITGFSKNRGE